MFTIVVYDINVKRTARVMRICKKYLEHVQKSVFEGSITEAKLNKLKKELFRAIVKDEDSIIIFKGRIQENFDIQIIGKERSSIDLLL